MAKIIATLEIARVARTPPSLPGAGNRRRAGAHQDGISREAYGAGQVHQDGSNLRRRAGASGRIEKPKDDRAYWNVTVGGRVVGDRTAVLGRWPGDSWRPTPSLPGSDRPTPPGAGRDEDRGAALPRCPHSLPARRRDPILLQPSNDVEQRRAGLIVENPLVHAEPEHDSPRRRTVLALLRHSRSSSLVVVRWRSLLVFPRPPPRRRASAQWWRGRRRRRSGPSHVRHAERLDRCPRRLLPPGAPPPSGP